MNGSRVCRGKEEEDQKGVGMMSISMLMLIDDVTWVLVLGTVSLVELFSWPESWVGWLVGWVQGRILGWRFRMISQRDRTEAGSVRGLRHV
jgi:hypothetical protein